MAATKNKNEPNEFDNDIKSQNRNAGEHRRHFIYRTTKKIFEKKMKKRTKRRPMKSKKKSKRSNCRTLYKVNDDNDDDDEMCTVIF